MGKFNVNSLGLGNGLLNTYSQELKEAFEIVNIPIDKIDENENNNYSIEAIDELIDSIRTVGLKQNLDVMKMPNGRYKLLTGHRRFKALKQLSEENQKYKMVPCTVTEIGSVTLPISEESKEKYLIHITNSTQRDMTEADKYNQYKDLVAIYTEAKNNGFTLSDKMRNLIANDMNVSAAQIGKMDYIRNNGTEDLEKRILENEVTIAEANIIAHKDKKEQATAHPKREKIIDSLQQDTYTLGTDVINHLTKKYSEVTHSYNIAVKEDVQINKKDYAKILESQQKILKELEKIQKIIS